jgi:segregation and condensation protein A
MDWAPLDAYLSRYIGDAAQASTVIASSFSASLELVREGELELRQAEPFAPLYLRRRTPDPNRDVASGAEAEDNEA